MGIRAGLSDALMLWILANLARRGQPRLPVTESADVIIPNRELLQKTDISVRGMSFQES